MRFWLSLPKRISIFVLTVLGGVCQKLMKKVYELATPLFEAINQLDFILPGFAIDPSFSTPLRGNAQIKDYCSQ